MTPARIAAATLCIALACAGTALAQRPAAMADPQAASSATVEPVAWRAHSGDAWIDRQLADINVYGARYRGAFIDELVRYHAAPRELVTGLVTQRNWAPGDVYYACTVAQIVGKPCRQVVELWSQGQADGWQAVSQRAGMTAPDSAARARSDIRESYVRWGRPLAAEEKVAAKPKKPARPATKTQAGKAKPKR